jgi:DNA-binding NarL/FixJ family response regulator
VVNVLLVEDSRISRETIESHLDHSTDYLLLSSIENAANAEIVCMNGKIDLVLMDVCTADDESGLKAAAAIKKHFSGIKIIIMTSMPEHSFLQKAKDCGCDGFWYKEYGDVELLDICDRVMAGETVWPEETPAVAVGSASSRDLTGRELDVLRELAMGRRYEEIADSLGITTNTVKYHIKNILQKTGCRSTLQLVVDVVDKKLILPKF